MTRVLAGVSALVMLQVSSAAAQLETPLARASRAGLDSAVAWYSAAASSPAYSPVLRREAEVEAAAIRARLAQGDFQAGDQIEIQVEGNEEMNDTATVEGDRVLRIAGVGQVPLEGVLRSELEAHLQTAVARIVRNPTVQARAFVRLMLSGAINRPGFYLVDADLPISDLLMQGGGQAREAAIENARIERGGDVIVTPSEFQDALRAGSTIEQLGLREGDAIVIPEDVRWFMTAREWLLLIPSLIGVYALLR